MSEPDAGGRSQGRMSPGLAGHETEILRMLAESASRSRMAATLGCSLATLDRFVARMRRESGARTNIELVAQAVRENRI